MKRLFVFSLTYFLVAMTALHVFCGYLTFQATNAIRWTYQTLLAFVLYLPDILGVVIALFLTGRRNMSKRAMADMVWACGGCLLFSAAFIFMKTSLPFFATVYDGRHHAIDGYVLIILVVGAWYATRKFMSAETAAVTLPKAEPRRNPLQAGAFT